MSYITELDDYQESVYKFATDYPGKGSLNGLQYLALGLGEAGEIQGQIKKMMRKATTVDNYDWNCPSSKEWKTKLALELGDLLWYVSAMAYELGYDLHTIAEMNYEKLTDRKEKGTINVVDRGQS